VIASVKFLLEKIVVGVADFGYLIERPKRQDDPDHNAENRTEHEPNCSRHDLPQNLPEIEKTRQKNNATEPLEEKLPSDIPNQKQAE
jgi:hypothetical protein